jgi:hypothetical protein
MAKNGPGRNGTPTKTGKTTQKRGEFGPQTLVGAEKGAKIQAKGSRCARHLARIFDQRPPRGLVVVLLRKLDLTNSEAAFPDSVLGPTLPLSLAC